MEERTAIDATLKLTELTGIPIRWKTAKARDRNDGIDGYIEIGAGNDKITMVVEAKTTFHKSHLSYLIGLNERYDDLLLLTTNLYEADKELLRGANINYLDTAGNAYFKKDDFFIFIDGKRKKRHKSQFKISFGDCPYNCSCFTQRFVINTKIFDI